ncbi:dihydrofolate reductase [Rubritalea squalenifaciens DSM 18772]|uniref:Dihydrofolate reductase n=2 Tax=Rubritalea TaxID=361050 RepID=A0A1M6DQ42_9BACT|nr:dihydrofolate reductase [Rubritalea squalenifaciens]SHI75374.1 dihydrofolate reductase [Rubritalea squalenifaciens DSM 18772]
MSANKLIGMVAMTSNRVIGKGNDLPWHLPEDLKLFKKTTSGHPIVMGRKTYDSIGRPLPNRQNIVITRDKGWSAEGVEVIHAPEDIHQLELMASEVYIIGGAQIYEAFLPHLSELLVSRVFEDYEGDTYFPEFEGYFVGYDIEQVFEAFELRRYYKE